MQTTTDQPIGLDAPLASGTGIKDSRAHTGKHYDTITLAQLLEIKHTNVPKDQARWFLCSSYNGPDAREHRVQERAGRFYLLTADIDVGNLEGKAVAAAVDAFTGGATRRVYSSNSSTADDKRWRVLVPLAMPESFDTWHALQLTLMRHLAAKLEVKLDVTTKRAGQVTYLPNSAPREDGQAGYIGDGKKKAHLFDWRDSPATDGVIEVITEIEQEQEQHEKRAEEARRRMAQRRASGEGRTVIEEFNAANDLEMVLEACGYKPGPRNSWRSPNQTTKSFATKVFDEPAGQYWVSQSGSDLSAGVGSQNAKGDCCFGDAFDLWCFYRHHNDRNQAIKAAAEQLGIQKPPSMAEILANMVRNAPIFPALSDLPTDSQTEQKTAAAETSATAEPPAAASQEDDSQKLLSYVQASHLPSWEPPRELVEGVLIEGSMSVVYGDSNTGKSFLVLDLAAHITLGRDWFGRRVQQGAVLYVAAESPRSIMDRSRALAKKLDAPLDRLFITQSNIDLFDPNGDVLAVVETVKAIEKRYGVEVVLIVVDTVARAMGAGDENKTPDMGQFVKHGDLIRSATRAALAYVHHTGKDQSRGARGSSALRAATDTEIEVTDPGDGQPREFKITKQRDLEGKGEVHAFDLVSVTLGAGVFGNTMTTCYVVQAEVSKDPARGLPPTAKMVMELIQQSPVGGLRWAELSKQIVDEKLASKSSLNRAIDELKKRGLIYQEGTFHQYRMGSGSATFDASGGGRNGAGHGANGREF